MKIPSLILRQLYTFGSLENRGDGIAFRLKNRLSDATLVGLERIEIDGRELPLERIRLDLGEEGRIGAGDLGERRSVDFPLRRVVEVLVAGESLDEGKHRIAIAFESRPFGRLSFTVEDSISQEKPDLVQVPYVDPSIQSSWAQYSIEHRDRDKLMQNLNKHQIPTAIYYKIPLHLQKVLTIWDTKRVIFR